MITAQEKYIRKITIMNRIIEARKAAVRPLESRRLVNSIHKKHPEYPVQAIWGIIGYMTRTNVLMWVVKNPPKGKSYVI